MSCSKHSGVAVLVVGIRSMGSCPAVAIYLRSVVGDCYIYICFGCGKLCRLSAGLSGRKNLLKKKTGSLVASWV